MRAMPKKKKYRYQTLLDMRERAKKEAMIWVDARRKQLREAEIELERREQEVSECRARQRAAEAKMRERSLEVVAGHKFQIHYQHLDHLKEQEQQLVHRAAQQQQVVARASADVEAALAALVEAVRKVKMIEKHREGWMLKVRLEETRREQKVADEIGAIIHVQRRSG